MTSITENITLLLEQIQRFENEYQRVPKAVTLLAVSKRHSAQSIRVAHSAGLTNFGENYLQEALQKMTELQDLKISWHFIGPIQANKTRDIAAHFHWVHSLDREKIARRLHEQRIDIENPLNVCVQINVSAENSKSGTSLNQCGQLCEVINALPNLRLRGLMAIPAPADDFETQRRLFHSLAVEFDNLRRQFPTMDTLSMGMSNDFQAAIAEGSTMVRIGSAIFGSREP